jgi:IS5 family transposase
MQRGIFAMRPRERRETNEQDLFRSRLDQIIDMMSMPFQFSSLVPK